MYKLEEQSDVFVDACATNHRNSLLFISLYGRDTSIQQFMARLHLASGEGGIEGLTLLDPHPGEATKRKVALRLLVGEAKRLEKLTGRMPRTGLLGNLVHAWIFHPEVVQVDHAAQAAWLFQRRGPADTPQQFDVARVWRLVMDLSPVPLMQHWCMPVLAYLNTRRCLEQPPSVGPIQTVRVEIPEGFVEWVSDRVRCGDFREQPAGIYRQESEIAPTDSADAQVLPLRTGVAR